LQAGDDYGAMDRCFCHPAEVARLPQLKHGGEATDKASATAIDVAERKILEKVTRVVFVSVPQYGTNMSYTRKLWMRVRNKAAYLPG